ncbi:MAG: ribokinase [Chloroflexi bacterium]|nr:ribokinase [Chloroflexota bacterium]
MDADRPVVVVGAAGIDIKARPLDPLQMGTTNRGVLRHSLGGVARNIAENLARLEVPTRLLSAVGQDSAGESILTRTAAAGVDVSYVLRLPDVASGSHAAILDQDGQLVVAVSEYDIIEAVSPTYLYQNRALFADAAMIVVDASLSDKALATVFRIARRYQVPVCADPTSPLLAAKLIPYLPELTMAAPDASEAVALCGGEPPTSSEDAILLAQCLRGQGVRIAIVTLAEQGLAYCDGGHAGHIPALRTSVVDKTGVGDALTAGVIFGLVNEMPLDEAIRMGVAAAAVTLRSRETVAPDLSLDRLYDELVV